MARLGLVRGKRIQETGERLGLIGGTRVQETIAAAPVGFKPYFVQDNEVISGMKKNVSGQTISAQMITISDGSDFTGTVTVTVTKDGGTQTAGGGTVTHEGGGEHSYAPTQAETDADFITFKFSGTGALTNGKEIFTDFPQAGDNFARLGAPAGASVSADIADLPTVSELNARTLVAASYFDPAADTVANVTTVATTTTNTDMRGTDSAATATALATVDTNVDAILVDTGTTIPAQITALNDFDPTSDTVANVTLVATTTANTDMRGTDSAFLAASAPTNFSSLVITVAGAADSLVQGYLNTVITETSAGRISNNFDFFYDNANAQTTQVVDDVGGGGGGGTDWTVSERNEIRGRLGVTGTTAAGGNTPTLSTQTSVDTVDTNVDSILVDTGTTIPAQITALNDFDPATDAVANVTLVATTTTNTDQRGTDSALLAADINLTAGAVDNVTTVATTTTNTDMRGTDSAATATALATAQLDLDTITGADGATLATLQPNEDFGAVRKNAAFSNVPVLMVLTIDHVSPAPGLTVTGQRSLDGGAFAGVSGTITEISNGMYQFDALAADTNGDTIIWRFSSATADDTFLSVKTVE